jgi:mitogen-activated protein kinase 1/3
MSSVTSHPVSLARSPFERTYCTGTPSLDEFYAITSRRSRDYIRALPIRKRRPFPTLFPQASPEAIDFLSKTLVNFTLKIRFTVTSTFQQTFDPKKRMNVDEALCHPYLASYVRGFNQLGRANADLDSQHDPEDEPVIAPLSASYFEFDRQLILLSFSGLTCI